MRTNLKTVARAEKVPNFTIQRGLGTGLCVYCAGSFSEVKCEPYPALPRPSHLRCFEANKSRRRGAIMNRDCEEGLRLRKRLEKALLHWGWFDAFARAAEIMPVGLPQSFEFQRQARVAETFLYKARFAYVDHMANCVVCSRRLVEPNAISIIQEKLKSASENGLTGAV